MNIPKLKGIEFEKDYIQTQRKETLLIELKTAKKHLPVNPKGFFFGATEIEFNFGKLLGNRFRLCLV